MPKYIIERNFSDAGMLTPEELKDISKTSNDVIKIIGPQIQWLQSFITKDKIFCVYISPNKDMIMEHALKGGFNATEISEITMIIDPSTAG